MVVALLLVGACNTAVLPVQYRNDASAEKIKSG